MAAFDNSKTGGKKNKGISTAQLVQEIEEQQIAELGDTDDWGANNMTTTYY